MSYTIQVRFQPHLGRPRYYLPNWEPISLETHLTQALGHDMKVVELTNSVATLAYDLAPQGRPQGHEEVVQMIANAAIGVGYNLLEAYVQEEVSYGVQAAVLAAAGGFGLGSRVRPEVGILAGVLAGVAGAIAGREMKTSTPILKAVWSPYFGWMWTDLRTEGGAAEVAPEN